MEHPILACIKNERICLESNLLNILPNFKDFSNKSGNSCKFVSDIDRIQNSLVVKVNKKRCFQKIRKKRDRY